MSTSAYNPGFMFSSSLPSNGITAKQSMQYQEYLSNTAHQRQMADLKAAGLNPWLADTSGASTPSGSVDSAEVLGILSGAVSALSNAVGSSSSDESIIKNILLALGFKNSQAEGISQLADAFNISLTPQNVVEFASDPVKFIESKSNSGNSSSNNSSTVSQIAKDNNLSGVFTEYGKKVYRINGKRVSRFHYERWYANKEASRTNPLGGNEDPHY